MPKGAEEGIRKGLYKFETVEAKGNKGHVQLLGSGAIFRHVREAAQILANEYGVSSDVYSVPSFTEVAREGADAVRWNMLHPTEKQRVPYIAQVMNDAPAVAATDYMKLLQNKFVHSFLHKAHQYYGLMVSVVQTAVKTYVNTFEVDARYVVVAALHELAKQGKFDAKVVADAIAKFGLKTEILKSALRLIKHPVCESTQEHLQIKCG